MQDVLTTADPIGGVFQPKDMSMTKAFVTSAITAAALLSGTAAFAAGKPHAAKTQVTKTVTTHAVKKAR